MVDLTKFRKKIQHVKETIPQMIDYKTIHGTGKVSVKKAIDFLDVSKKDSITLSTDGEIRISTKFEGVELPILSRYKVELPKYVLQKLGISGKATICFIQRSDAVAIKRLDIKVIESDFPRIIDIETSYVVTRQIETFGDPKNIYKKLETEKKLLNIKINPNDYWKDKSTFHGWKARQILDIKDENDKELQLELIQLRLSSQSENGSWKNELPLTAKVLIELFELGLTCDHPQVAKAISWLLEQPQSPHNPGMFFLSEDLVQKQIKIIDQRLKQKSGSRPRFRNRVKSEINQIYEADELYYNPCGPRIMWVNGIVMETLLRYGYESHKRIQVALDTLAFGHWCECHYQHGKSSWKRKQSLSLAEIEDYYNQTLIEFKQGGIVDLGLLSSILSQTFMLRLEEKILENHTEYLLRMPMPQQGCEYITVNALSHVINDRISRLVEAHLWRFAALLYNTLQQPIMSIEGEQNSLTIYFQLRVLAKYDSLPSKLGILFALPWIINNQNKDGTWGTENYKESATLAVIEALKAIDF
ncbi:MAG: hypothetical protein ACFFB5_15560 [Promethearchaeota archaeon]